MVETLSDTVVVTVTVGVTVTVDDAVGVMVREGVGEARAYK